jgi:hypothetical protein
VLRVELTLQLGRVDFPAAQGHGFKHVLRAHLGFYVRLLGHRFGAKQLSWSSPPRLQRSSYQDWARRILPIINPELATNVVLRTGCQKH